MRIAQLTLHSCPLAPAGERDAGGMNVYVLELSRQLEARDFCVDIFTRYHTARDPEVVQVGPRTRVVHVAAGRPGDPKEALDRHVPEFVAGVEAFREDQGLSYGLVHSHYWLSGQAGLALAGQWDVPHITSFHTLAEVKRLAFPDNHESPVRAAAEAQVARHADRVLAWTPEEAEALVRLYNAPPDRISVVLPGVNLSLFHPRDRALARRRLRIPPQEKVLLFIGRLEPIKGTDLLLDALALLEDTSHLRILLVGGDQREGEGERLRARASALGLDGQVWLPGAVPHEELPWYYGAADLLVVPSYYESFSMVTAEALACGTPVVAARVGGLASLVEEGVAGYLVPSGDARAFAGRIALLLQDEERRARMAAAAPGTVAHLGWPAVAQRIVSLYGEVLRGAEALTACVE